MKRKILVIYLFMILMTPLIASTAMANEPPTPPKITCPENVKIGKPFPVEAVSTDPEGDECYYRDEFNGCTGPWFGPYPSGQAYKYSILITGSPGTYTLGLQSKDTHDAESEWVYVQINATKNKAINTPFINFLQSHPNLFPLLQKIIQQLRFWL